MAQAFSRLATGPSSRSGSSCNLCPAAPRPQLISSYLALALSLQTHRARCVHVCPLSGLFFPSVIHKASVHVQNQLTFHCEVTEGPSWDLSHSRCELGDEGPTRDMESLYLEQDSVWENHSIPVPISSQIVNKPEDPKECSFLPCHPAQPGLKGTPTRESLTVSFTGYTPKQPAAETLMYLHIQL